MTTSLTQRRTSKRGEPPERENSAYLVRDGRILLTPGGRAESPTSYEEMATPSFGGAKQPSTWNTGGGGASFPSQRQYASSHRSFGSVQQPMMSFHELRRFVFGFCIRMEGLWSNRMA